MDIKNIVNFIFELGQLKRQVHTGWWHAGVKNPVTVGEHVYRAAQIGYILAVMEGVNPERVASILVMHDNPETRTGDFNKVVSRYYDKVEGERKVLDDQLELLGEEVKNKWQGYFDEIEERKTQEGVVAKDSDWLEVAFQAKEYYDQGYRSAQNWINNVEEALETESAKSILAEMKQTEFTDWLADLKKMTYKKLG